MNDSQDDAFRDAIEALLRDHPRWAEHPEWAHTYRQWEDLEAGDGDEVRRFLPTDLAVVRTLGTA